MHAAALALDIKSDSLVKAANDLDRFSSAAEKAAAAGKSVQIGNPSGSIAKLVAQVQSANAKLTAIVGTLDKIATAERATAVASENLTRAYGAADAQVTTYRQHLEGLVKAQNNAGSSAASMGAAAAKAAASIGNADAHVTAYREHLQRAAAAGDNATAGFQRTAKAVNDNAGAMRANVGNLAAQFQDIAVSSAGGMSPMLIAFQQGTQLSAALAQSGGSAFSVIGGAIRQVLSPMSLFTLGLVGAAAALLQMVDWSRLAQTALNGFADAMVATAPYAVGLGGVLAVAFGPQIIAAIGTTAVAIGTTLRAAILSAAQAMIAFAIANPFSAFVLGAAAAVAAVVLIGKAFGKDFVTPITNGINFVVGGFVGAFDAIKKTWRMLPAAIGDSVIQTANAVIRAVDNMVNRAIDALNGLTAKVPGGGALQIGYRANSGQFANPNAGAAQQVNDIARQSITAAQKVDYVGKAIAGVNSLAAAGAAKLREWAGALGGAAAGKTKPHGADSAGSQAAAAAKPDPWADLLKDADKQQRALDQAGARVGVYGQDLAVLTKQQELFNAAQDAGVKLTAAQTAELQRRAAAMGAKDYQNTRDAAAAATNKSHDDAMRALLAERDAIGLTGTALVAYNYQQQLINAELAKGVALKDIDIAKIADQAKAYADAAAANDATRRSIEDQRKAMEANQQAAKAFFTDWIDGVRQGESVFHSFARSVEKALNNIIDQMLNAALNQALGIGGGGMMGMGGMGGMGGGPAGVLGGFLGTLIGKGIVSLFGSIFANGGAFGTAQKYALGGAFDQAQRFATGGAFTNQIIANPTLFKFAGGAKMGLMGEAGPEAIMPLKRGPNGSLGVQSHGGGGNRAVSVEVHNHISLAGALGQDSVVAIAQGVAEQTEHRLTRNLPNLLQRLDQDGTL